MTVTERVGEGGYGPLRCSWLRDYFRCIMEQYIIQLKDSKHRKRFMEVIERLDFVEIVNILKDGRKASVALDLMEALQQVKGERRGGKKLRPLKKLVDEL